MDKQYLKDYYKLERTHWWFLGRKDILRNIIEKHLKLKADLKILNVGAATGYSSQWLSDYGKVTTVEYDRDTCDFLKSDLKLLDVHNESIEDLPFKDHSYDLVTSFDVIEHVDKDRVAVAELARTCNPGGYVFITVPAYQFLWSEHDDINQHKRRYTMGLLKDQIADTHEIVFSSYFNSFLFFPIAAVRLLAKILPKKKNQEEQQSDFDKVKLPNVISSFLYRLFKMEAVLMNWGIRFPFGVSICLVFKKKG